MCASLICRRRATPLLIKTDASCVSFSTMSVWTCLSWFSPTLPSNSWALGALFLFHTGRDSFPRPFTQPTLLCISINWKNKMFDMLPIFSAGRLLYLKFFSTLYSRILYSIGGTGHCTPNGCTSMSTVSTTSKQYCFTSLHLTLQMGVVFVSV